MKRAPEIKMMLAMNVLMLFVLGMMGNLLSILLPYRIASGSMKRTKVPAKVTLLIFLSGMLFPPTVAPLFAVPLLGGLIGRWDGLPHGVILFFLASVMLGIFLLLYWISLPPLARLLEGREKRILDVVTHEVE